MTVSPILYGALHFFAWSDHFLTPLERLLWHVSSVVVARPGLVLVLLTVIVYYFLELKGRFTAFMAAMLISHVMLPIPIAYTPASGFLVVGSPQQMFPLDLATYQPPSGQIIGFKIRRPKEGVHKQSH